MPGVPGGYMPDRNQMRADKEGFSAGPPTTTMRMGAGNKFSGMLDDIRNKNQMGIRDLIEMNARLVQGELERAATVVDFEEKKSAKE